MDKQTQFAKHMGKIDSRIADLIDLIEQLGLNPNDESHCVKVLADLFDDIQDMTGMYY
jgi:hypothetical protein